MSLNRLFPNVAKKKVGESVDNILYICLVEFGWSWTRFRETPIPIILTVIKKHKELNEKRNKK